MDRFSWHALGIRQRLVVALALPLLALLVLGSVLDYRLARETTDSAFDQALSDCVFDLERHIRAHNAPPYYELNKEAEAILRSIEPDKLYFSVRDARGVILAGDFDLPPLGLSKTHRVEITDTTYRGQAVRGASLWLQLPLSEVEITVLATTVRRRQTRQHILTTMLLQNFLMLAVSLATIFVGLRQGLRPLRDLEDEIANRSADDLREIALAAAPSEIRRLLQRLNELFAMMRDSAAVQKRFVGDAAHQLRTPLAGLQTQLDLAAGAGLFHGHPERQSSIEAATARISHLLSQLLAYAQAEGRGLGYGTPTPVDLVAMIEHAASSFVDAALPKEIDLGFDLRQACVIGHAWLLLEALANLVDNAVRYTPAQGIVTVRCGCAAGEPFFEVEDNGPGIPPQFVPKICERFFRLPGTPGNGCGLGLSIVDEIARAHGAELRFAPVLGGGFRAGIYFASSAVSALGRPS